MRFILLTSISSSVPAIITDWHYPAQRMRSRFNLQVVRYINAYLLLIQNTNDLNPAVIQNANY